VKLPKFLGGTPATSDPRRRRRARAGAPRTIIPIVDEHATPSWLKGRPAPASAAAKPSLALDLDAARERLRREIPPVDDL
jgi:hypothetical protein